jgi:hypothetical protein
LHQAEGFLLHRLALFSQLFRLIIPYTQSKGSNR